MQDIIIHCNLKRNHSKWVIMVVNEPSELLHEMPSSFTGAIRLHEHEYLLQFSSKELQDNGVLLQGEEEDARNEHCIMKWSITFDSSGHRLGRGDGNACSGKSQRNNEERSTEHEEKRHFKVATLLWARVQATACPAVLLLLLHPDQHPDTALNFNIRNQKKPTLRQPHSSLINR